MNKIPEPLDIMPKSMRMHDEQIKTGAQISFLNLERFLAGRQNELEKLAQINGLAAKLSPNNLLPGTPEHIVEI